MYAMTLTPALLEFLSVQSVNVLRLCAWLILLSLIFLPLEHFFALRGNTIARREQGQDLAYYFLNSLLPMLLLAVPLSLAGVAAQAALPAAVPAALGALPLAAQLALAFVLAEMGSYWGHRLSHTIPFLWRFHALHHSPAHLYYLVNTRAHPVDLIVTRLAGLLPLYVLGLAGPSAAGSVAPAIVILVAATWGFFIHANVRLRFGPLEWLVATPFFHHWHHNKSEHINCNYAPTLPLVDKLFGTLHLPQEWPRDYGLEQPVAPGLAGQLADPLRARPQWPR